MFDILQDSTFLIPIFAVFGLCFGSFATMASHRLVFGEDTVVKSSYCPKCRHSLGVFDLFPLFSWLFSAGKCRYCKAKISCRYPLIELATSLLFVFVYVRFGLNLTAFTMLGLVVCLVILTVTDLEHRIIPDEIQIAVLVLGIIYRYSLDSEIYQYFSGSLFGLGLAFSLYYGFLWWKKKEGLGFGDIKFFAASGMFLGVKAFIPFLFFSGVFGIVFAFVWKKLGGEEQFPFGPALAASMLLCLAYPEYTVDIFYYN